MAKSKVESVSGMRKSVSGMRKSVSGMRKKVVERKTGAKAKKVTLATATPETKHLKAITVESVVAFRQRPLLSFVVLCLFNTREGGPGHGSHNELMVRTPLRLFVSNDMEKLEQELVQWRRDFSDAPLDDNPIMNRCLYVHIQASAFDASTLEKGGKAHVEVLFPLFGGDSTVEGEIVMGIINNDYRDPHMSNLASFGMIERRLMGSFTNGWKTRQAFFPAEEIDKMKAELMAERQRRYEEATASSGRPRR